MEVVDLAMWWRVPSELKTPGNCSYAEDELVWFYQSFIPLQNAIRSKEDLYKLEFIALDSQSTIRKVIDSVLSRCEMIRTASK